MCGIAGLFHFQGPSEAILELLQRFNGAQSHRGPDQADTFTAAELRAGLAATRLAVVGVGDGAQPLSSRSGATAARVRRVLFRSILLSSHTNRHANHNHTSRLLAYRPEMSNAC